VRPRVERLRGELGAIVDVTEARHPAVGEALGADELDVVDGGSSGVDRGTNEREHEP